MTAINTNYFTFREASEITGLNEATIRRLSKRPESKPYIQMKKGKKGSVYTIQADYLFGIYPRLKFDKSPIFLRVGNDQGSTASVPNQEAVALLAAKDELIQYLKNETVYLRNNNLALQQRVHELESLINGAKSMKWSKRIIRWVVEFWHDIISIKRTGTCNEVS